ncbi:MAG: glycosyltransferase, partial [Cyanobacteria bacterium P01_G01_bin.38]
MKVLFLTSEFPPYAGGAGEYVYQVSANLCRDCGFNVKVLASTNHFDPNEVREFDSHFPGKMVRYADLPLRRVKALYYPLTALYRFFKSLLVYLLDKPDVVVACDDSSAKIVFLMHRLLGFRYVVITHGSEFLKESSFYFRALESADFLTFHSLLSKSFLDKARPLLDVDYAVINAGADEKIYDIENPAIFEKASGLRAKLGIDDHAKVILTVGTVSDRKGQ